MSSKASDYEPSVDLMESQTQLEKNKTTNKRAVFLSVASLLRSPFPENSGNFKAFRSSHCSSFLLIAGGTLSELSGQSHAGRQGL